MRFGDIGIYVRYLQLALKRAGYAAGELDGVFGMRTNNALTAFQKSNGLAVDGIAGRRTWAALYPYLSGYTVHAVRSGETLFGIAERYGSTVSALETANPGIAPDNLTIGARIIVPLSFPIVSSAVPYSYAYQMMLIDGLTARYPFLSERRIGRSVMGKSLDVIRIGTGSTTVFYNASHHANEWITSVLVMAYLENYAGAVASGKAIAGIDAQALYEKSTLYLLPLVNPDGVDLVTGALPETDSYYRQAAAMAEFYPSIPFPSGWKANISGVDLNLGYPAGWEQAKIIKYEAGYTRPGPRDYVGRAPLAEPENQAVYAFTRANEFKLTLSWHTQGEVIFYRYLNYDPPRATQIGRAFEAASGYALQETPYESGFAGYKDWFIQTYNLPGYTLEAGRGISPLPLAQFPEIYRDCEGILTLGMELADGS